MSKIYFTKIVNSKHCKNFKWSKEENNWVCEYHILKKIIKIKSKRFDMKSCFYTKKAKKKYINFNKGAFDIVYKECKFYHVNLLQKTFNPPY